MTDFEKYSLVINSFFALVTFAAVMVAIIVAIWGEWIRQLWAKPKPKLSLIEPSLNRTQSGIKGWYYMIRVSNDRPKVQAKNVRILLTKMYKKGPDGSWKEQKFSGPTLVMWRWPQLTPLYTTVGADEYATFGYLLEDTNFFRIKVRLPPMNFKSTIPKNESTRLVFKAVSDSTESNSITVEVTWDGIWVEGSTEMKDHLIVEEVIA